MAPTIMKLDDTNYAEWSILMRAVLVRQGLWDVTSGTTTRPLGSDNSKAIISWRKKNDEACAEITLNLDPAQLPHVHSTDAATLWLNLETVHQSRGLGTRLSGHRNFFQMRKDDEQAMTAWIAAVRRAAFRLQKIGANITDEDLILVLTSGLPVTYEAFVITLDATPEADLTLEFVVKRLLNEDSRQNQVPAISTTTTALAASTSGQPRTPIERITCFNCLKKGHYKVNCPNPASTTPGAAAAAFATVEEYAF